MYTHIIWSLNLFFQAYWNNLFDLNLVLKKVQSKLRIKANKYLVNCTETGIIWLLFLFALAFN